MPFVYGFLYIICMVFYICGTTNMCKMCDSLFYVSPIMVIGLLILSRLLRLCGWHRTACIVPIIPQIVGLIDYYVIEFPFTATKIIVYMSLILTALLLICAYKVFIK